MSQASRLPLRVIALSTALAFAGAAGTYVLLRDDGETAATTNTIELTPQDEVPSDPDAVTFTTFEGDVVALSSLQGKPVLVNFFASTCVPCITEMPDLEEVHRQLGDEVTFLGLALQDRPEDAASARPAHRRDLPHRPGPRRVGDHRPRWHRPADHGAPRCGRCHPRHPQRQARRRRPAQDAGHRARPGAVINAPLAIAFGSGMLATVNPCGFAMLPAYLGYFLGVDGRDRDVRASVGRSLGVGLSVSAGFLAVFSIVGLAIYHLSASVDRWTPWATIVIGGVLIVLGIAMLRGFEPVVSLPKLNRGGRERTGQSMFVFGVSYAIASISCALPLFTGAVAGTFRRENLLSSLAVFVAYSLGMTLVLLALTVSMGMARQSIVRWLRQTLPYITRASGGLLIVVGAYLAYYGRYEMRLRSGEQTGSKPVDVVTGWSDSIARWVNDVGPTRLGLVLALALVAVLSATFGVRTRRRS